MEASVYLYIQIQTDITEWPFQTRYKLLNYVRMGNMLKRIHLCCTSLTSREWLIAMRINILFSNKYTVHLGCVDEIRLNT